MIRLCATSGSSTGTARRVREVPAGQPGAGRHGGRRRLRRTLAHHRHRRHASSFNTARSATRRPRNTRTAASGWPVSSPSRAPPRRAWDPPPADGHSPEAEWGFDAALLRTSRALCGKRAGQLERLAFPRADTLSGPVAELYRSWYAEQGAPANRLLVSCFAVIDAHLPLTRGLVPYWSLFGTRAARDTLDDYLRGAHPLRRHPSRPVLPWHLLHRLGPHRGLGPGARPARRHG